MAMQNKVFAFDILRLHILNFAIFFVHFVSFVVIRLR